MMSPFYDEIEYEPATDEDREQWDAEDDSDRRFESGQYEEMEG